MLLLLPVLLPAQVPVRSVPERTDWMQVPHLVVTQLETPDGSWMGDEFGKSFGNHLQVSACTQASGSLDVLVSDSLGMAGLDLVVRFTPTSPGQLRVDVSGNRISDIPPFGGPVIDLHGDFQVQAKPAESSATLKFAFRLHGILLNAFGPCTPLFTEGVVALPLEDLTWPHGIQTPLTETRPTDATPTPTLHEVLTFWPDETPRTHGWLSNSGLREGLWKTWYPNGSKQSEATFVNGQREGPWNSYDAEEKPFETGRLRAGVREGSWTRHEDAKNSGRMRSTHTGNYAAGLKTGLWTSHWENRTMQSKGAYKEGRAHGPWTEWWPNGNKRSEGTQRRGYPEGEWTYWHEDGSVRHATTHKLPPWAKSLTVR